MRCLKSCTSSFSGCTFLGGAKMRGSENMVSGKHAWGVKKLSFWTPFWGPKVTVLAPKNTCFWGVLEKVRKCTFHTPPWGDPLFRGGVGGPPGGPKHGFWPFSNDIAFKCM